MRRLLGFLVVLAVLWCGLHLSPAEADDGGSLSQAASTVPSSGDDNDAADHDRPHVSHACHSHCPVAVDVGGLRLAMAYPRATALFAFPPRVLTSVLPAPPIEPPTA
jgi:hypothetical protein